MKRTLGKKNKKPVVEVDWKKMLPIMIGLVIAITGITLWWILRK